MSASSDELAMHQRVLSGHPVARAEVITALYFDVVEGVLRQAGTGCDAALAEEKAGDALLQYAENPGRYDPERSALRTYLILVGHSKYRTALWRERQRAARQYSLSNPQTVAAAERASADVMEELVADIDASQLKARLISHFDDPRDKAAAALVLDDTQGWEPYVDVLGLSSLPVEQQKAEVYRVKSRVKKRLQRLRGYFDEPQ